MGASETHTEKPGSFRTHRIQPIVLFAAAFISFRLATNSSGMWANALGFCFIFFNRQQYVATTSLNKGRSVVLFSPMIARSPFGISINTRTPRRTWTKRWATTKFTSACSHCVLSPTVGLPLRGIASSEPKHTDRQCTCNDMSLHFVLV